MPESRTPRRSATTASVSARRSPSNGTTNRHNRRFRYYISRRLITKGADPTGWRLPAPHLEAVVLEALRTNLRTRARQHDLLLRPEASKAGRLAEALNTLSADAPTQELWPMISEVHITAGSMIIHFSREALAQSLDLHPEALNPDVMSLQQAFQRRRRGAETRLVTGTAPPSLTQSCNRTLRARIDGPTACAEAKG